MHARSFRCVALSVMFSAGWAPVSLAGGGGHGGGAVFRPGMGLHASFNRGGVGTRFPGLPPVAGVIHERPGARFSFSAYGHTSTAAPFGGFGRNGGPAYGRPGTALPGVAVRPYAAGYGHLGTAFRRLGAGAAGEGRRRFAEGRRFGGFGDSYGFGGGFYGAPGIDGDAGVYGGEGTYGQTGTYGGEGTDGGTTATQSVYGTGDGEAYRSETPLAARFAEPPLGPSPYAGYSPGDRYAYAASEDVRPSPRVVNPYRAARSGCACGSHGGPVFYRYGVGTAY